jgi:hypothetical protein
MGIEVPQELCIIEGKEDKEPEDIDINEIDELCNPVQLNTFQYEFSCRNTSKNSNEGRTRIFKGVRLPEDPALLNYFIRLATKLTLNKDGSI